MSVLRDVFQASELRRVKKTLEYLNNEYVEGFELGRLKVDNYEIGLYEFNVKGNHKLARNRVGLRNLVKHLIKFKVDAALVVYHDDTQWRLSFISDLLGQTTAPKRFTYLLGNEDEEYRTPIERLLSLSKEKISFDGLKNAFSVEVLSKEFYKELFTWYQWALSEEAGVTFPNDTSTNCDDRYIDEHIIRLITRLLFVWFIKQKGLVLHNIFQVEYIASILKNFKPLDATQDNYYRAILQNLFFATLNKEITGREFVIDSSFQQNKEHYGIKTLYRYADEFSIPKEEIIKLFSTVPFLNGGLFECLDKEANKDSGKIIYSDGFSRRSSSQSRAHIPNNLFFDESRGIIPLLKRYNFTVEENTPDDIHVALDPELLGKVFENLLGDYNQETKQSARKSSGSFYTPREIVHYMVDESLIAYLSRKFGNELEAQCRKLMSSEDITIDLTDEQKRNITLALKECKILDPACGSGAFPMGILTRILDLLGKINPESCTYDLKLHLIKNCIYGVDIQPIAVQISKLRFFISLIVDQAEADFNKENFGISPLPNLETKFVAANTLIAYQHSFSDRLDLQDADLQAKKHQLWDIRNNKNFLARTATEKAQFRKKDSMLCKEIGAHLAETGTKPNRDTILQLEKRKAELEQARKQYQGEKWETTILEPRQKTFLGFEKEALSDELFKRDVHKENRDKIDLQLKKLNREIENEQKKASITGLEAEVEKIISWNPYDQNSSSSFFDKEWMFGLEDGFDIVIGNPPYIQLSADKGKLADMYKAQGFKTFERTGDIYSLFYEQGYNLLKDCGCLCFITSNKWMRAGYGASTRNFFVDYTNPILLIDFAGQKIFESATVDVNILLLEKSSYQGNTRTCIVKEKCPYKHSF